MDNTPKYDLPWELITDSLSGSLGNDDQIRLQQWLTADPGNQEQYSRIKEMWNDGLRDYTLFKNANANKSWDKFQSKIAENMNAPKEPKAIELKNTSGRKFLGRWIAIAAIFLGLVAVGTWFTLRSNKATIYETFAGQQRTIEMMDGSIITIKPNTRIEIARNYNQTDRRIKMQQGEAFFDVIHVESKPFLVTLGTTQVQDIGTSFTIVKNEKEIKLAVETGKVEFTNLDNKERKALSAGTSITYDVRNETFGKVLKDAANENGDVLLDFNETSLSEAVISIEKVFGKKIQIADTSLESKKITAHLDGMPYNTVIEVVCKSLGLESSVKDGIYTLKKKTKEQP
jgi:transmembrane sensor